jgi:hypothetical protein
MTRNNHIRKHLKYMKQKRESMPQQFYNPDDAFDQAIDTGRLSADPDADNYAGNYMYMGRGPHGDRFKNITTREYLTKGEN